MHYYKKNNWEQEYIDEAIETITKTYNEKYQDSSISSPTNVNPAFTTINENDFISELFGAEEINYDELQDYLQKAVVSPKTNPLEWWKVDYIN